MIKLDTISNFGYFIDVKDVGYTFIIRSSGESTTQLLVKQIEFQLQEGDSLFVLSDMVCFEEKLRQSYEIALRSNKKFAVIIDGDILLRRSTLRQIKKISLDLNKTDFGFGLLLWDRFYGKAKFRGLHIYRTQHLEKALTFIPTEGTQLRPESFVKKRMEEEGCLWRNNLSTYVAGIHDYCQNPRDIYYKFWVRAKRSKHEVESLKHKFSLRGEQDFKIALKGLQDGLMDDTIANDKSKDIFMELDFGQEQKIKLIKNVDALVVSRLIYHYGLKRKFWQYL